MDAASRASAGSKPGSRVRSEAAPPYATDSTRAVPPPAARTCSSPPALPDPATRYPRSSPRAPARRSSSPPGNNRVPTSSKSGSFGASKRSDRLRMTHDVHDHSEPTERARPSCCDRSDSRRLARGCEHRVCPPSRSRFAFAFRGRGRGRGRGRRRRRGRGRGRGPSSPLARTGTPTTPPPLRASPLPPNPPPHTKLSPLAGELLFSPPPAPSRRVRIAHEKVNG